MVRNIDCVVAGHLCIDVFPSFTHIEEGSAQAALNNVLVPGKLVDVGPLAVSTGGAVSNTGLALLALGMRGVLMGKVGDDSFGLVIRDLLERRNAGGHLIIDNSEHTSYTVVLAIPGTDRIFLHHPGCNDTFCAGDVNYDVVRRAKVFHFGYPPLMKMMYADGGCELATMLRRAREAGAVTSLDMALPDPASPAGKADWPGILRKALPHVDIFLPSVEEMLYMLDRTKFDRYHQQGGVLEQLTADDLAGLADSLLDMGCKAAVIKCGHLGIYARTGECSNTLAGGAGNSGSWRRRELWEPVFVPRKLAGTTGAGDCTIAGFLAAFIKGLSIEQCLRYATAVGAENVEALDAVSGMRSWNEVTARLQAGWKKAELTPSGPGWTFDAGRNLWFGPRDGK